MINEKSGGAQMEEGNQVFSPSAVEVDSADVKAIAQAVAIQKQIDVLHEKQDQYLDGIAKKAIKIDCPNYTTKIIEMLPRGFYSSELRTWHFKRLEDESYSSRLSGSTSPQHLVVQG